MDSLYWNSIILGVIEGITEFLPVSSTGHLIVAGKFLGVDEGHFSKMFDIVIQFGAILAVVVYFWNKLMPSAMFTDKAKRAETLDIWFKSAVGVIPAVILGALLHDLMDKYLFTPIVIAFALIVGGILLLILDRSRPEKKRLETIGQLPYWKVLMIGLIQCLSMIPGTSRSAATIIGGLCLGASRSLAAEFSFFLAIPTMTAASTYKVMKEGAHLTAHEWTAVAIGFAVSFFVAWAVIAMFMAYIKKKDFRPFAWYRIALGTFVLIWFLR